jgi:DNA repair ATPase RecN
MEEEMRKRREIKLAEKEYRDNLERAREVAELGAALRDSYKAHKSLSHEDTRKLERIEKLAKKIRNEAGGSDEDTSLDDPPRELEPALSRLAEVSGSLRKVVEKTPRQVVSAAVIQQANALLQLLKFCRSLFH